MYVEEGGDVTTWQVHGVVFRSHLTYISLSDFPSCT